jgi:N6-adenosine-specific RNA methylase IME4
MTLDQIKDMPVGDLAEENCALLLWATWPNILMAFELITAWGFIYKTVGYVWVKNNASGVGLFTGMGYYTRANSEPCLLAIKGTPERLDRGVHQVIISPIGEHSEKPREAHERTMRLFDGPYLELFARKPAAGWTTWGEELVC